MVECAVIALVISLDFWDVRGRWDVEGRVVKRNCVQEVAENVVELVVGFVDDTLALRGAESHTAE